MSNHRGVVVRPLIVTDLSQQLKKQRDFLKWMARRYKDNPDQAAAFTTGADLFQNIRLDLIDGLFDEEER